MRVPSEKAAKDLSIMENRRASSHHTRTLSFKALHSLLPVPPKRWNSMFSPGYSPEEPKVGYHAARGGVPHTAFLPMQPLHGSTHSQQASHTFPQSSQQEKTGLQARGQRPPRGPGFVQMMSRFLEAVSACITLCNHRSRCGCSLYPLPPISPPPLRGCSNV